MLLVNTGSPVGDPTVATLVNVPPVGAATVKVTLLMAPLARLPKLQTITPLLFTLPALAPTKLAPKGTVSVTVTLLATDGPKLVTEIVYSRLLVASTDAAADLPICKSACEV